MFWTPLSDDAGWVEIILRLIVMIGGPILAIVLYNCCG